MPFINLDSNDLDYWSGQPASKADIALIVSRLVRATTPSLQQAMIPKGKSTFSGGWDGEIRNSQATEFVPEGLSFWEFGTEARPAGKAQKDYMKRTKNTAAKSLPSTTMRSPARKEHHSSRRCSSGFGDALSGQPTKSSATRD